MGQKKLPPLRPLLPHEQKIVADNMGLVHKEAGIQARVLCRILNFGSDDRRRSQQIFEDLSSAGYIGLCIAAQRYDPNRLKKDGTPHAFSTYAYYWIGQSVRREADEIKYFHKPLRSRNVILMFSDLENNEERSGHHGHGDTNELDVVDDSPNFMENDEHFARMLELILKALTARQSRIVIGCAINGITLQCMTDELGVCRERVRQILVKSIAKLVNMDKFMSLADDMRLEVRGIRLHTMRSTNVSRKVVKYMSP